MTQISHQLIDKVLEIYKPDARWLKNAELEYPLIKGIFEITPGTYTHKPFLHMTDIEAQLCLNQLAYVGIAEAIRTEIIPKLKGLNFEELQCEGMLIIKSKKIFRKAIKTDKQIQGELEIKNIKKYNNLLLSYVNFQFENRSCFGCLELALVNPSQTP